MAKYIDWANLYMRSHHRAERCYAKWERHGSDKNRDLFGRSDKLTDWIALRIRRTLAEAAAMKMEAYSIQCDEVQRRTKYSAFDTAMYILSAADKARKETK